MDTKHLQYWLYSNVWKTLDLIYPPRCCGCGELFSKWCTQCIASTYTIPTNICHLCGKLLKKTGLCKDCIEHPPSFSGLRSWAAYQDPIRKAIHKFKYKKDISLGMVFSNYLVALLDGQDWQIDIVVPVPLSIARQRERGYNQCALLAKPLAMVKGLKYNSSVLTRTIDTKSQVNLTLDERRINVKGAFLADIKAVTGKTILLIDDVTTSGATMDACSAALLDAGAYRVYGLTLARTL